MTFSEKENDGNDFVHSSLRTRRLRRAQSSCKLFWSGVPVRRRVCCAESWRTTIESRDCSFFTRCASSITIYYILIIDTKIVENSVTKFKEKQCCDDQR